MIKRIYAKDGIGFITVTTRKANYADEYFGKFTFWKSKQAYENGDCEESTTYTNIPLGIDKNYLEIEVKKFCESKQSRLECKAFRSMRKPYNLI